MSAKNEQKYRELDYFNAVGCVLVILIHVLSLGITGLDPGSWQFALIFFPWQLSAYVVPAFLFCGAVKLALTFPDPPRYGRYILRRFRKIYLPFLVWTVIYYLAFIPIGYTGPFSLRALGLYVLRGDITSPFYYIITVMQFYLLAPLWRCLTRRVPWHTGCLLAMFVTLLMYKADVVLARFGLTFGYFDRVFPTYLIFWVAGLYVGRHYSAVRSGLAHSPGAVLPLAAIPAVFALLAYLQRRQVWLYDLGYLKPLFDLAMITLVLTASIRLEDSGHRRVKSLLGRIHAASFTAFLSHCLYLTLVTWYLQGHGVSDTAALLAARAAVCCTLPFATHWLLSRARGLVRRKS